MDWFITLLCWIPAGFALGAALVVLRQKEKELPQYQFILMLLLGALSYALEGIPASHPAWALGKCLSMLVVPQVFPVTLLFLCSLYFQSRLHWFVGLLFLPAVVFSSVVTTLNLLLYPQIGSCLSVVAMADAAPQLYAQPLYKAQLWVCGYSYPALLLVYGISVMYYGIVMLRNTGFSVDELKRFLRGNEQIPMLHVFGFILLVFFPVLLLRIAFDQWFPWLFPGLLGGFTVLETSLLLIMGLASRRMNQPGGCNLSDLGWNAKPRAALAARYSAIDDNTEIDEDLLRRFKMIQTLEVLMQRNKIFRNADLSIDGLAAELCTNRLYLSRLVNAEFGMNFRSFLNDYRVEYAQQYMLEHPDANQDAVASASGFQSAQTFNKKFKEVVGLTPKAWSVMKGREITE